VRVAVALVVMWQLVTSAATPDLRRYAKRRVREIAAGSMPEIALAVVTASAIILAGGSG
jgi:hypothetical protein